jgi:hypothetical protein
MTVSTSRTLRRLKDQAMARFAVEVAYDPAATEPESLVTALDILMNTALSTPGILDDYGSPVIGNFTLPTNKQKKNNMTTTLDLSPFYGSECFWTHGLGGFVYTEGVKYIADNAGHGAYWLLDAIGSYQSECKKDPMLCDFQIWKLDLDGKGGAMLTCWPDSGPEEKPVITQKLEFTDFPQDTKLYLENNTLMLPAER